MTSELVIVNTLLETAKDKISEIESREMKEGLRFNIFRILDRFDDEEKGHSAFIAELLNPKGKHGQKNLFLKLFFECLIDEDELTFEKLRRIICGNDMNFQVKTEVSTINGRIDLLIRNNELAIAIENKVYAEDQPKQLQRYKEYLNELKIKNVLIYLTLYGDEPSNNSKGNLATEDYYCISYDFISNWLNACILKCDLIHIKSVIEHYKQCIETLIGKPGTTMTNELSHLILKNGNLNAAIKLSNTIDNVKTIILEKFFKELELQLSCFIENIKINSTLYVYGQPRRNHFFKTDKTLAQYFKKNRNKPRYFGYVIEIYRKDEHIANLEIRLNDKLYFVFLANDSSANLSKDIVDKFCQTQNMCEILNRTSKKPIVGKINILPQKELNFQNFNNYCIQLSDDEELKTYIDNLLKVELSSNLTIFTDIYEKLRS